MLSELQILATVTSHSNSALLAKNRPPAAPQMVLSELRSTHGPNCSFSMTL
jgi:hypothetical protein